MKKKVIISAACLVIALGLGIYLGFGAGNRQEAGMTRCLLVGCDRFVSMPGTEPASANNVSTMAALMKDFLPEGTIVTLLVNGPGTAEEFEQLAEETFRGAKDADTAIVYLSTHGLLQDGAEGREMTLLLSDGTAEDRMAPADLRRTLDRVPGKKVLILDACHSGAVIGSGWDGGNAFEGSACRVLTSSGAQEDSWFWNTETDEYTGTGYFTAAMDRALRASDLDQIDPDGTGGVSLTELTARLREIHGASTVCCYPEDSGEALFRLPADRKPRNHLLGVSFGQAEQDGDTVVLPIRFRAGEAVRVMYQLVPGRNGKWDFEHAVRLPDREKTGLIRGLLSPGEKERKIRLTKQSLGEDGKALMQIITFSGESMMPSVEAGSIILIQN